MNARQKYRHKQKYTFFPFLFLNINMCACIFCVSTVSNDCFYVELTEATQCSWVRKCVFLCKCTAYTLICILGPLRDQHSTSTEWIIFNLIVLDAPSLSRISLHSKHVNFDSQICNVSDLISIQWYWAHGLIWKQDM